MTFLGNGKERRAESSNNKGKRASLYWNRLHGNGESELFAGDSNKV